MSDFLNYHTIEPGPFDASWDSLRKYKVPEWYRDAKLGIWAHWGPQCAPMHADWYARQMYMEGHQQYLYHCRTYGHPSKFGFKDVAATWKAEKFDPDALMQLYIDAGAKYFFAQAVHHDNFDNWNSKHNRFNSVKVGPMKDILSLWREAARKRGLPFGVSEHLGASFSWWRTNKGADKHGPYAGVPYDGNDPVNRDIYHDNLDATPADPAYPWKIDPWYATDIRWQETWLKRMLDLIDQHQPDLLYSDGGLPWDKVGLSVVAHLYNLSAKRNGGKNIAVYNQKNTDPQVYSIGVLDIERGNANEAASYVWQNDTCVAGWFYDKLATYKKPHHVVEILVDCVSKNGNLLLNLTQRPDGTFDDECMYILKSLAKWIKVNGEGIYATRPWKIAGEGPSKIVSGHFKEDAVQWTTADIRFTSKGNAVYAYQMKYPERGEVFIRALSLTGGEKVANVHVLGHTGKLVWRQLEDGLLVQLPEQKPVDFLPCIKVELE